MNDKPEWKIVSQYGLTTYPCGVRAGDQVKLRADLPIRDHLGQVTRTHPAEEIWEVLSGVKDEPDIVWLRQPDGKRHTWDDAVLFDTFEWLPRAEAR